MDETTKAKLSLNLQNSYKMWSNWVMTASGAAFAIYLALPPEQQQALINHLPVAPWLLPIVGTVIGVAARLWPQKSITPVVAEAKSADTPAPSVNFPLHTGPAPLPTLPPHDS